MQQIDIFKKLESEKHLQIRKATSTDMDLLFKWVNDPDERKNAVNSSLISYKEHCLWFSKKITSENTYIWILEQSGIPTGQIRFDIDNNIATLSYFIDREYRRKGFGLAIVRLGIERVKINNLVIRAIVRKQNIASCKIFEYLNFNKVVMDNDFVEYLKYEDTKIIKNNNGK